LDVSFQPGHPYVSVRDRDGVVLAPSGVVRRRARAPEQQLAEEARARADLEEMVRRLSAQRGGPDTASSSL